MQKMRQASRVIVGQNGRNLLSPRIPNLIQHGERRARSGGNMALKKRFDLTNLRFSLSIGLFH